MLLMQPASELFAYMIILFALGVCLLFAFYMRDMVLIPIKGKLASTKAQTVVSSIEAVYSVLDQVFFFAAIGLGMVSVLLAYMTPAKPAFLFLAIILFVIALLVIPQFANIWQNMAEDSKFSMYANSSSESELFLTWNIFKSFPTLFWIFGFLILVVLFGKVMTSRGGEGSV